MQYFRTYSGNITRCLEKLKTFLIFCMNVLILLWKTKKLRNFLGHLLVSKFLGLVQFVLCSLNSREPSNIFIWVFVFLFGRSTLNVFTCSWDKISSWDETSPRTKKFLFSRKFHPGMKRVEFHPGMKFNFKKTSHWVWKHIIKLIILGWHVKTLDDYFFKKVTLLIIFVCLFSC